MKMMTAILFMVTLSSCTYAQVNDASMHVYETCKRVVPLAKIASLLPTPPAAEIAAYVILACDANAGLANLLADPYAEVWLNDLNEQLRWVTRFNQIS
jgi:hypothetical protein